MAASKLRTYKPIWDAIKTTGQCRVACELHLQPRLIKAVIKEKYQDEDEKHIGKLSIRREKQEVEFKLLKRLQLIDLLEVP